MSPPLPRLPLRVVLAACTAVLVIGAVGAQRVSEAKARPAVPVSDHAGMKHHAGANMSDDEMQAWVDDWFANHPRVGLFAQGTPVVTFRAFSLNYDYDSNPTGTPTDSVVIGVGDIVEWQRVIGAHTITNGVESGDPDAGALFDQPLDAANPVFQFQFNAPGRYPFFCRPHESFNMRGVVIVIGATPTEKTSWGELKAKHR